MASENVTLICTIPLILSTFKIRIDSKISSQQLQEVTDGITVDERK
jgi:hypothetical protein